MQTGSWARKQTKHSMQSVWKFAEEGSALTLLTGWNLTMHVCWHRRNHLHFIYSSVCWLQIQISHLRNCAISLWALIMSQTVRTLYKSRQLGFLPQSTNMHIRLITKMWVCVNGMCPVVDWWPVRGVFLPLARWLLGSSNPRDPD